jgi:4-carboxymuconolactone decarboxylase
MSRIAKLSYEEMAEEQKRVHDEILAGPRTHIAGPMNAWFRSPQLASLAQKLGAFCRFQTTLPPRLSEFAILVVARHWTAQIEWWAHQPLAVKAGIEEAATRAIADHREPSFDKEDERILYAFAKELVEKKEVSDQNYATALEEFGEQTLVELVAVLGYYTSVAMILNCFQEMPDGEPPLKA